MANSRILELSSAIARDTAIVEDFCRRNKIASPSLDLNSPPTVNIPHTELAAQEAQDNIIAAARELMHLMRGPARIATDIGYVDAFVFHAISRFNIAEHVPVGGQISFEDLSGLCGMNVSDLRRVLRFAMTNGYFCEPSVGHVSHTSLSRVLAESELARGGFAFTFEEAFPASAKTTDALYRHPGSQEPILSGWGLANSASKPLFAELHETYPERHRNASTAMDTWNSYIPASPLVDNFPWSTVDTIVDIGGGHGHVSLSIAKQHNRPKFIVQDLPNVVANGPSYIPDEYRGRIQFMEHDMFTEQPIRNADVYFFRSIFHDWPDKYCVRMLQALIPAMKPGARVVINDACMPPPGTLAPTPNRLKRMWDLTMMLFFNARDREDAEWAQLFQQADKRYRYVGSRLPDVNVSGIPPTFLMNIIEAVWEA